MRIHKINYVIKVPFDDNGALLPAEKYKLFEDEGPLGTFVLTDGREYCDREATLVTTQDADFTGLMFNLGEDFYYRVRHKIVRFPRHHFNFIYMPSNFTTEIGTMKGQLAIFCIGFTTQYLKVWYGQFPSLSEFVKKSELKNACSLNRSHLTVPSEVISLIDQILLFPNPKGQRDIIFTSKVYDILFRSLTDLTTKHLAKTSESFKIEAVTNLFVQDLRAEWTMELLADRLDMHPSKLRRMLNRHSTTVLRLLTEERLQLGFTLVKEGSLSLYKIAKKIGYSSVSNFIRAFKKRFSITPEKLRGKNN